MGMLAMGKNAVRLAVWGIVLLAVLGVLLYRWYTDKVNNLVDEANRCFDEANVALPTDKQLDDLVGEEPLKAFPQDRAKFEKSAQTAVDSLAKAAEKFQLAAAKYDDCGKASKDKVAQYFDTMSKASQKLADSKETYRQAVALLLDKSIESAATLRDKRSPLLRQASDLDKEYEQLDDQAKKIHEANKNQFK
jgi:hypothetical protein